jgi:UDP-GlcNAc:undecaprenyl-phosphate GlcNAc-1-phosphate transferase
MTLNLILIIMCLLLIVEILYFKLATHFQIIDRPNSRSSHSVSTIRGGGIIFPIAMLLYPLYYGMEHTWFLSGLLLISLISFADDINPVNNKLRLVFHTVAVTLLFYQLQLFVLPWYFIVLSVFFAIGTINAINFMDGINGLTGGYAFITLLTLLYINEYSFPFTDSSFLIIAILAVTVFNIFNFRIRAKCFAGDVGSISIGFIIVYFVLQLIIQSANICYILLLLVYGLDTVSTIIFRLIRKENILEPHRSHFYQYLYNEKRISPLKVSIIYILLQLLISVVFILLEIDSVWKMILIILLSGIVFVKLRFKLEGTEKLLG